MIKTPETPMEDEQSLVGQLLVAMPGMPDPRFAKTVIYLCGFGSEGAMGLVINRPLENMTFMEILEQLGIPPNPTGEEIQVRFGGPVEGGRGFVLHSADYQGENTLVVDDGVALTATVDILREIAEGGGPRRRLIALGYAGWGPGQLESEIKSNGWLLVRPDEALVFDANLDGKWEKAMGKLGIDPRMLSDEAGHA
jgi:putative transcriptional regulator